MNNSGDDDSSKNSDVNIPPITLPDPDPFDTTKNKDGKFSPSKRKRKKSKEKKGRHPLDTYKDVRKKKSSGCCGGIGCLALVLLLLVVGVVGGGAYFLVGDFKDYAIVPLEGADEIISTAPTEPTLYIGKGRVTYHAASTSVPIAIMAPEIEVSGDFLDNLSLRGAKIICLSGSHCRKDLNIYAVEYTDEGIQVDGVKSGKTMR